jgi:hypothetical protein
MFKTWGVKNVKSLRSDVWCSDVVSFSTTCRWCVDGVIYWLRCSHVGENIVNKIHNKHWSEFWCLIIYYGFKTLFLEILAATQVLFKINRLLWNPRVNWRVGSCLWPLCILKPIDQTQITFFSRFPPENVSKHSISYRAFYIHGSITVDVLTPNPT